jgi:hypothetical protein
MKHEMAAEYIENQITDQFINICDQKSEIKQFMKEKQAMREQGRAIESSNRRIVHFIFNPLQPCKMTPFTRKFVSYLDGSFEELEAQDREAFESYLDRLAEEQLEEGETNPIQYPDNKFFELELNTLDNLSFAVADNPFIKSDTAKFFPECLIVSGDGHIIDQIGPTSKQSEQFESVAYLENFRDDLLKVNDDRKIKLQLSEFEKDPYTCIFLMARVNDNKRTKTKHYNQAWFRLQNEDTNQTLDYSKFSQIRLPEGFEDAAEDEGEDAPAKGELIYIIGRIYCELVQPPAQEGQEVEPYTKWVYEKYNKCVSSARFPDMVDFLSHMNNKARADVLDQQKRIEKAKEDLIRIAEEKRQAQLAALAKKNEKGGAKKKPAGKKEEEEQKTIEIPKEVPKPQVAEKRELDLTDPRDFAEAVREKVQRPFTFGPIDLEGLDSAEFDMASAYDLIIETLEQ